MGAALRRRGWNRRRPAAARPCGRRFRRAAAPLLLTVLTACAIADGRSVPVRMEAGTGGPSAGTQASVRRPPPIVAPASATTAATAPAPMTADIDAASMLGLDGAGVAALLGEPAYVRREPPAEVWQYRGTGCVLDLFLYDQPSGEGPSGGSRRVAYVEARTGAAEPAPVERCIAGLLTARRPPRTS